MSGTAMVQDRMIQFMLFGFLQSEFFWLKKKQRLVAVRLLSYFFRLVATARVFCVEAISLCFLEVEAISL